MKMLAMILALSGCADAPMIDQAMTRAMETGGCVKLKCTWPPMHCRPSAGVCR